MQIVQGNTYWMGNVIDYFIYMKPVFVPVHILVYSHVYMLYRICIDTLCMLKDSLNIKLWINDESFIIIS